MKIIRVLIYCMYVFNVRKIADQFPLSFFIFSGQFHNDMQTYLAFIYIIFLQDFIKAEPTDVMRTPVRNLVLTTCANLMYPPI